MNESTINTAESGQATAAGNRVIDVMADAPLALPNDNALLTGDYVRSGEDLRIEGLDGSVTILQGYFADGLTPDLVIGGAVLKGKTIEKIAREPRETEAEADAGWGKLDDDASEGWGTIGQAVDDAEATPLFAQADASAAAASGDLGAAILGTEGAIAQITEAYGIVEVIRADGTRETVGAGAPIFEDDVLLTQEGGSVGVTFVDGMSFSLGESAKMVFDEFAYDPANHSGGGVLSVLQGAFSFISGEAAHTAEDALMIETPTMTIGVRGTKVVSQINPDGQTSRIAIMSEESGRIGKIMVKTDKGETILDKPNSMVEVTSRFEAPSETLEMSSAQAVEYFGSALSVLPAPTDIFKPEMIEAGYEAAAAAVAAAGEATGGDRPDSGAATQTFTAQPTVEVAEPAPTARTQSDAPNQGQTTAPIATATVAEEPVPAPAPQVAEEDTASAADTLEAERETEEQQTASAAPAAPATPTAPPNTAPTATALANASANEDQGFAYDLSSAFSDADGDALTFSATLADGSAIPGWMTINPTSGVLAGTPDQAAVGTMQVSITATDPAGARVTAPLTLTIANVNDTPTVVSALTSASAAEDTLFSLDVSSTFGDVDIPHGDTLAYGATLSDGSPLPGWLSINSATGELSGTPTDGDLGAVSLKVTATDTAGTFASTIFTLTVNNTNDAPTVSAPITDKTFAEDSGFTLYTASNFSDADSAFGDTLTYTATLADGSPLPGWLTFNGENGQLSGSTTNDHVGTISLKITATDAQGLSAHSTFDLTVTNVNDAPVLSNVATPTLSTVAQNASAPAGDTVAAIVADGSITDVDGAAVEAIAVTGVNNSNGTWQYSTDGGTTFTSFGAVADNNATLLDESALVRFVPNAGYTGAATFIYRAWDKSDGHSSGDTGVDVSSNGGTTAYSTDIESASVTVEASAAITQAARLDLAGAEVAVNTETNDVQTSSSVAGLSDGGHVVIWQSKSQDGDGEGIYGQRFAADGSTVGGEFRVHTSTALDQTDPQVIGLANGGFAVVWTHDTGDGVGKEGVRGQIFNEVGSAVGGEFSVNTGWEHEQMSPSMVALPDGGFVVAWQSKDVAGVQNDIFMQRFSAEGTAVGGEVQINTISALDQIGPSIALQADGTLISTWSSKNQDGNQYGVYMQRTDVDGNKIGGEVQVNTYTTADQTEPEVTALTGGGYVIAWTSDAQDGDKGGIFYQVFDASGNAVGAERQANTTTAHDQIAPSIEALADGGYVIAWESNHNDGDKYGVFAQRFDASGAAIGGETGLNTTITDHQTAVDLSLRSDGSLVATWTDKSSGSEEIVSRVFDANSGPQLTAAEGTGTYNVTAGASDAGTLVATDVDGDALVFSILNNGAKGTATIDANTGQWTYAANGGESGTDSVSYQVSDGEGGVDTLTLTFAIS